jgi:Tol biopolymer transport system component
MSYRQTHATALAGIFSSRGRCWVVASCLFSFTAACADEHTTAPPVAATPRFAAASTSPAAPAIAFTRDGNKLMVMNADGSNQTVLLSATSVSNPSWSPAGTALVMSATVNGTSGIWLIDVALVGGVPKGSNLRFLTSGYQPAWSARGDTIIYIPATGISNSLSIIPTVGGGGQGTVIYTSGAGYTVVHPDWSPDNTRIAFGEKNQDFTHCTLIVFNRETRLVDTVTAFGPSHGQIRAAEWSRAGDKIAFSAYPKTETKEHVYIVAPLPRSSPTKFFAGFHPTWSPDDSKLAFVPPVTGGPSVSTYDFLTRATKSIASKASLPNWRR